MFNHRQAGEGVKAMLDPSVITTIMSGGMLNKDA